MSDFNPFSVDSQFATVIERLKSQDQRSGEMHAENRRVLGEILLQTKATNGRVTKLELQWRWAMGCAAGVSLLICSGWKLFSLLHH